MLFLEKLNHIGGQLLVANERYVGLGHSAHEREYAVYELIVRENHRQVRLLQAAEETVAHRMLYAEHKVGEELMHGII